MNILRNHIRLLVGFAALFSAGLSVGLAAASEVISGRPSQDAPIGTLYVPAFSEAQTPDFSQKWTRVSVYPRLRISGWRRDVSDTRRFENGATLFLTVTQVWLDSEPSSILPESAAELFCATLGSELVNASTGETNAQMPRWFAWGDKISRKCLIETVNKTWVE